MVTVKEVETKKEQKQFLDFYLDLYKGNPYYAPPLYLDEKNIFKKDYVYNTTCDTKYFLAYKDGKVAGRISAILQKASNEKWGQKRIRFTRFDSINDKEVSRALFDAVFAFAKEKQMDEVVGPLGFSDLEREGLLIEGFDYINTFEEQYNYDYYKDLIEDYGFGKEVDWLEHKLTLKETGYERLNKYCDLILKRYHLHVAQCRTKNEFIRHYADQFVHMIDVTYDKIYGTVPFTPEMKANLISNFKLIVDLRFVNVIVDENDTIVCFAIAFPSISKALQKSGGHLTLPCLIKVLKAMKHPEFLELGLAGVDPKYAQRGVASMAMLYCCRMLKDEGIQFLETNLNLEDNKAILSQWQNFNSLQHKRRRCFIKKV